MYNIYGITVFFVFCWVQKRVNTCFATTNLRKKMIGCIGKFAFYKKNTNFAPSNRQLQPIMTHKSWIYCLPLLLFFTACRITKRQSHIPINLPDVVQVETPGQQPAISKEVAWIIYCTSRCRSLRRSRYWQ